MFADAGKKFVGSANELIDLIFSPADLKLKEWNGRHLTVSEVAAQVHLIVDELRNVEHQTIDRLYVCNVKHRNGTLVDTLAKEYEEEMNEFLNSGPQASQDFQAFHEELLKKIETQFGKKVEGDKELVSLSLKKLSSRLNDIKERLKKLNRDRFLRLRDEIIEFGQIGGGLMGACGGVIAATLVGVHVGVMGCLCVGTGGVIVLCFVGVLAGSSIAGAAVALKGVRASFQRYQRWSNPPVNYDKKLN